MNDLKNIQRPPQGYYAHVDRPTDAPLGVRVVQLIKLAHNKETGPAAIYRPLDPSMPVYEFREWDYRPLAEFLQRYMPVLEKSQVAKLDALRKRMYAD
jgi:hypothetical protein